MFEIHLLRIRAHTGRRGRSCPTTSRCPKTSFCDFSVAKLTYLSRCCNQFKQANKIHILSKLFCVRVIRTSKIHTNVKVKYSGSLHMKFIQLAQDLKNHRIYMYCSCKMVYFLTPVPNLVNENTLQHQER